MNVRRFVAQYTDDLRGSTETIGNLVPEVSLPRALVRVIIIIRAHQKRREVQIRGDVTANQGTRTTEP
jgi:hypothetical protein